MNTKKNTDARGSIICNKNCNILGGGNYLVCSSEATSVKSNTMITAGNRKLKRILIVVSQNLGHKNFNGKKTLIIIMTNQRHH